MNTVLRNDLGIKLYAPESYWRSSEAEINALAGGCGPGGKGDYLVPDTMYGLSVFRACRIHDYMYAVGKSLADKEEADRAFRNNMIRIIDAAYEQPHWMPQFTRRMLRNIRRARAQLYYQSVKQFGGSSFWNGKNRPATFNYVQEPVRELEMEP